MSLKFLHDVDINGHITPAADNAYDIGNTSSLDFRTLYIREIDIHNQRFRLDYTGTIARLQDHSSVGDGFQFVHLGTEILRLGNGSSTTATFAGDVIATDGSDTATLKSSGVTLSRSNSYIQSNNDNQDTLNIGQPSVRWGNVKVDGATFKVFNGGNERFGINSSGNSTFAGDVTTSGTVTSDTYFYSSDASAVLATTGAGSVFLRPNGGASGTGAFSVNSSGKATVSGELEATSLDINGNADISGVTLLGTTDVTSQRLQVNGYIDITAVSTSALRWYNGSTFRGGLGLDDWAHSGSSSDITMYVSGDNSFHVSTNNVKRLEIDSSGATIAGNADISGDLTVSGSTFGLYHQTTEDGYYHDNYTGTKNLSLFLKNQRADILRYRQIDNYEYWNGSAWVADSSKESSVKNLLDGRQDTSYNVPARDYKFRFTTSVSSSWPTTANIGIQTSWSGSTFEGCQMLVEQYISGSWVLKATMEFGGSGTSNNSNDNGVDNWGLMFKADGALHTGQGSSANTTRITIDFYGWSPSNSSYTTIPLQNIFITSNYAGTENTDYTNLLDYDRNVTIAGNLVMGAGKTVDGVDISALPTSFLALGTTSTTAMAGNTSIPSISGLASTSYVDTAVANVVDSSPAALNTLNELAAALGDDANYATTTATAIGTKLPLAGGTMTGDIKLNDNVELEFGTGSDVKMKFDGSDLITTVPTGSAFMIGTNGGTPNDNSGNADFVVDVNASPQISFYSGQVQIGGTNMNWNAYLRYDGSTKLGAWDNDIHIFQQGSSGNSAKNIYIKPQAAGGATTTVATFNGDTGTTFAGVVTLGQAPTSNLHAATKAYVDGSISGLLPLAGGTMSGDLATGGNAFGGTYLSVGTNGITQWGGSRGIMTWGSGYSHIYAPSGNVLKLGGGGGNTDIEIGGTNIAVSKPIVSTTTIQGTTLTGTSLDINGNADIAGGITLSAGGNSTSANINNSGNYLQLQASHGDSNKPQFFMGNNTDLGVYTNASIHYWRKIDNTNLATLTTGQFTVTGEIEATSLDINGNADISGTLNVGQVDADGNLTVTKGSATIKVEESGGADVRMAAGGSTGYIGTYSNDQLYIQQNGSPAITIDTSRNSTFAGAAYVNGQFRWAIDGSNYAYSDTDGSGLYIENVGATDAKSDIRIQARASGAGNYSYVKIRPSVQDIQLGTNNSLGLTIDSSNNAIFTKTVKLDPGANTDVRLKLHTNSGALGDAYSWNMVSRNSGANYQFEIQQGTTTVMSIGNSAAVSGHPVTFAGSVSGVTATTSDNTTKFATTAFVKAQGYLLATTAPGLPASITLSIVNDTINVTFGASATSDIDNYLVFSSVAGSDYSLISVIPPEDMASSMSIIDNSFDVSGTQAYRIYAVKGGLYSAPRTGNISFSAGTVEATGMNVVNLNKAYYIQWDAPSSNKRFVTAYNLYKHDHATEGSLAEGSASLIYSGMNTSFMYTISGVTNDNFHKFWVTTTVV